MTGTLDDFYIYTDKGYAHNTLGIYRRLLIGVDVRDILEIGILHGDSLRMWASVYDQARVVGVDIEDCRSIKSEFSNISVYHEDAYDLAALAKYGQRRFDLIIDDGSHILKHQCFAAEHYSELLSDGGIFVVEDVASIEDAHVIQHFLPDHLIGDSYIIDRRGAPCDYPYERFDNRNEILVVVDKRI